MSDDTYADHALAVWAVWHTHGNDRLGWSRMSSEARAMELIAQGGQRAPFGPRIPRIDQAVLGPKVDRLLLDMDESGKAKEAQALRARALWPRTPCAALAERVGVSPRTFRRHLKTGREHLDVVLTWAPRR